MGKNLADHRLTLAAAVLLSLCASSARSQMTDEEKMSWFISQPENRAILDADLTDDQKFSRLLQVRKNKQTLGAKSPKRLESKFLGATMVEFVSVKVLNSSAQRTS